MVKEQKINAIVTEKDEKNEVRCGYCGKKLSEFEIIIPKNSKKVLTNNKKYVIITVKCGRCSYTNSFRLYF